MKNETRRVVYRHPKGRFIVIERRGKGIWGKEYRIRETVYPRKKQRKPAPKPKPQLAQTIATVPIPEQDKTLFAKLYNQGYSVRKISQISGRSDDTVFSGLIQTGAIRRKVDQEISQATEQDEADFAALYRQGYTITKIAAISGWSKATVSRHLRRTGAIRE